MGIEGAMNQQQVVSETLRSLGHEDRVKVRKVLPYPCARLGCERLATQTHPHLGFPVCSRHANGLNRRLYSIRKAAPPIWAHVEDGKTGYQGCIAIADNLSSARRRAKSWRLRDDEG